MTIEEAKNDLIATLQSIDKDKLSLSELQTYAQMLKTISEIQTKSYVESLAETLAAGNSFGFKATTVSELK